MTRHQALKELGCAPDCSRENAKKAYRREAQRWHPDKHGGSPAASEQFLRIKGAYDALRDWVEGGPFELPEFAAQPPSEEEQEWDPIAQQWRSKKDPGELVMRVGFLSQGSTWAVGIHFFSELALATEVALNAGHPLEKVARVIMGLMPQFYTTYWGVKAPRFPWSRGKESPMTHWVAPKDAPSLLAIAGLEALWARQNARVFEAWGRARTLWVAADGPRVADWAAPLNGAMRMRSHGALSFLFTRAMLRPGPQTRLVEQHFLRSILSWGGPKQTVEQFESDNWALTQQDTAGHSTPARPFLMRLLERKPWAFGLLAQAGWFNFRHPLYTRKKENPWASVFASPLACESARDWILKQLDIRAFETKLLQAPAESKPVLAAVFEEAILNANLSLSLPAEARTPVQRGQARAQELWEATRAASHPSLWKTLGRWSSKSKGEEAAGLMLHAVLADEEEQWRQLLEAAQERGLTLEQLRLNGIPLAVGLALARKMSPPPRLALIALGALEKAFGSSALTLEGPGGRSAQHWLQTSIARPLQ